MPLAVAGVLLAGAAYFASTEAGAAALRALLQSQAVAPAPQQLRQAQAIVLVGGRTARYHEAGRLYRRTGLPILVTGRGTGDSGFRAESERMGFLLGREYDAPVRWLETLAVDTEENAAFSACLLRPAGIRRIALVTSPVHMLRARLAFEAAGFEVVPAPAFDADKPRPPLRAGSFLPGKSGMLAARAPLKELAGSVLLAFQGLPAHPCAAAPASAGPLTSAVR